MGFTQNRLRKKWLLRRGFLGGNAGAGTCPALNLALFGDGGGAGAGGGTSAGGASGAAAAGGTQGAAAPSSGGNSQKAAASAPGAEPVLRTKRGTPIYGPKGEAAANGQTANGHPPVGQAKPGEESFDSLVKGKYKAEYDANVQSIVQSRLKNAKNAEEKLAKLSPLLEALGSRYKLDASDISRLDLEQLTKSVVADQKYLEEEATQRGIPLEQMKHIKELEFREEQRQKDEQRTLEERRKRQNFERLVTQGTQTKQVYPGFDLQAEMQNPAFQRLISGNVPVRTAYEVIHKDEIISGAMQYTAQKVQQKISKSIQAGGARPVENGITAQQAGLTAEDIQSKQHREELKARARRGEKVII